MGGLHLDRCEQGQVMRMLETVNFLVSHKGRHGGGCFVVLGMDPDYVQGCIALNYKDLAEEIQDRESEADQQQAEKTASSGADDGDRWSSKDSGREIILFGDESTLC